MSSPTVRQDVPPKGGFSPIHYKRNVPARGPSGAVLFAGVIAMCSYGWYWNIQGMRERRELERETVWGRIHLVPLLQAEADRAEARVLKHQEELEKEVMKVVPDWEKRPKVYNTERFVAPTFIVGESKWTHLF